MERKQGEIEFPPKPTTPRMDQLIFTYHLEVNAEKTFDEQDFHEFKCENNYEAM